MTTTTITELYLQNFFRLNNACFIQHFRVCNQDKPLQYDSLQLVLINGTNSITHHIQNKYQQTTSKITVV